MALDPQGGLPQKVGALLTGLPKSVPITKGELREEVRVLAQVLSSIRGFSKNRLAKLITATGARERILQYLSLFVGETIDGDELEVVSGIHEYPRRVRELRVQEGYKIATGVTRKGLRTDQYVLDDAKPDNAEAERWQISNQIRRAGGSVKSRMLALLKAYLGKPVSIEQFRYVGKGADMRRVRELRTEEGWRISTRFTGRPELAPDVYVLEGLDQLPQHDRKIDPEVYDAVLRRDNYSCRKCGWKVADRKFGEKRQFIELHHIEHHKDGGANNLDNLVTMCNVHHDSVHALRLGAPEFLGWLVKGVNG